MRTKRKRARAGVAELLFSGSHRRLLALLLLRPEQSFHLRQIERLTGLPAGSLHRELSRFAEAGLLTRTQVGNQVRYQANRSLPVYEDLAGLFRKTSGLADVLREALRPLEPRIETAFIFGSVAQGKDGVFSDVDLMVVGSPSFDAVVAAILPARERLGREVNPVVMRARDFRKKLDNGERFVSRLMAEPRIMLMGELVELAKLAEDRPA